MTWNAVTCVQFNPVDDSYFLSGSLDYKLRTWSIPGHQVVDWIDLREMITAVSYVPDGEVSIYFLLIVIAINQGSLSCLFLVEDLIKHFVSIPESNCWFPQRDLSFLQHQRFVFFRFRVLRDILMCRLCIVVVLLS